MAENDAAGGAVAEDSAAWGGAAQDGAAGGRASQGAGATGASSEEVQALLAQWDLQCHAVVFAELGLEKVSDLKYLHDSDAEQLPIPTLARRKVQAMLEWWRKEHDAEPPQKKVTLEAASGEEGGAASGGGKGGEGKAAASAAGKQFQCNAVLEAASRCWRAFLSGPYAASGGGVARGAADSAGGVNPIKAEQEEAAKLKTEMKQASYGSMSGMKAAQETSRSQPLAGSKRAKALNSEAPSTPAKRHKTGQGSAMLRMDFEESGSGLPKNRSFPQSDMASFPQSDMAGSFGARGQDVRKVEDGADFNDPSSYAPKKLLDQLCASGQPRRQKSPGTRKDDPRNQQGGNGVEQQRRLLFPSSGSPFDDRSRSFGRGKTALQKLHENLEMHAAGGGGGEGGGSAGGGRYGSEKSWGGVGGVASSAFYWSSDKVFDWMGGEEEGEGGEGCKSPARNAASGDSTEIDLTGLSDAQGGGGGG